MKIKLDENMPVELKADLARLGHDVATVYDQHMVGWPDERLIPHLRNEGRVLVTLDKGIADVRRFPPAEYAGLVLVRPASTGRATVRQFTLRQFEHLGEISLAGRLLVLSDAGVRLR